MSHVTTAPAPRPGRRRRAPLLPLVAVAVALLAAVASTEENEPRRVDDGSGDGQAATPGDGGEGEPEQFGIGDVVELGTWQVQVHGVTDPIESADQFLQPAEGHRWVGVDVEVVNTAGEPGTVSSIMCFEIVDDQSRSYSQTITGVAGSSPPDGEVAPGGSRRGTLEYEVPADAAGLRLNFQCDLLSQGTATIVLDG